MCQVLGRGSFTPLIWVEDGTGTSLSELNSHLCAHKLGDLGK